MLRLIALFVFSFILILPVKLSAQETGSFMSGAYLMKLCEMDGAGAEKIQGAHTACQSYIAGIIDYHKLLKSLGAPPSIDLCVPNTTKLFDLQKIVWVYLEKSAHHDAFNAAPAVSLALYEYYPCAKK